MIDSLPLFHAVRGQPVIVLGHGDAAEAKRRLVERAGATVLDDLQEGIDKGARLAFITHADDAMAEADAIRARCAGLLVNVTDKPALCDFTVPSILDRTPVLVAFGTGGASAGLAKHLRLRLETLLPQSLGRLAGALKDARTALRQRWPDAAARRRALDAALTSGGVLDPLREDSADKVQGWLAGEVLPQHSGVFEVRLTSLDPEDLTLRTARLIGEADTIACEPGIPEALLVRARADAVRCAIAVDGVVEAGDGLTVVMRAPTQ